MPPPQARRSAAVERHHCSAGASPSGEPPGEVQRGHTGADLKCPGRFRCPSALGLSAGAATVQQEMPRDPSRQELASVRTSPPADICVTLTGPPITPPVRRWFALGP